MLEEATAADWGSDWETAARCSEQAWQRTAALPQPDARLTARCVLARGRTEWRDGRVPSAIELLREAARQAELAGDSSSVMLAKLILAPALVWDGQLDRAEAVFAETLALCEKERDRFHQCAVHANRMFLWTAQKKPGRAEEDLRAAMQLARELGNPSPERVASHNLAELLYRSGEEEECLALARRSRALQERFWQNLPEDALLLARIHAARQEYDRARHELDWLERECRPESSDPIVRSLFRTVKLAVAEASGKRPSPDGWDALLAEARQAIPAEELIEVLWWRARTAIAGRRWDEARHALAEAQDHLVDSPVWTRRIELLASLVPPGDPSRAEPGPQKNLSSK